MSDQLISVEQVRLNSSNPQSRSRFYKRQSAKHHRRLIDFKRELCEENARIKAKRTRATLFDDFDFQALLAEVLEAQERTIEQQHFWRYSHRNADLGWVIAPEEVSFLQ